MTVPGAKVMHRGSSASVYVVGPNATSTAVQQVIERVRDGAAAGLQHLELVPVGSMLRV